MESAKTATEASTYGGFKGPHCSAEILTPKGFILVPGQAECPTCGKPVVIDERMAQSANHCRTLLAFTNALLGMKGLSDGIHAHGV